MSFASDLTFTNTTDVVQTLSLFGKQLDKEGESLEKFTKEKIHNGFKLCALYSNDIGPCYEIVVILKEDDNSPIKTPLQLLTELRKIFSLDQKALRYQYCVDDGYLLPDDRLIYQGKSREYSGIVSVMGIDVLDRKEPLADFTAFIKYATGGYCGGGYFNGGKFKILLQGSSSSISYPVFRQNVLSGISREKLIEATNNINLNRSMEEMTISDNSNESKTGNRNIPTSHNTMESSEISNNASLLEYINSLRNNESVLDVIVNKSGHVVVVHDGPVPKAPPALDIKYEKADVSVSDERPDKSLPEEAINKFNQLLDTEEFNVLRKHPNLIAIFLDWKVTKNKHTAIPAIILVVPQKGMIPFGFDNFPAQLSELATDVISGIVHPVIKHVSTMVSCTEFQVCLRSGISIGACQTDETKPTSGTLTGFATNEEKEVVLLTNEHVAIYDASKKVSITIRQPSHYDHEEAHEKLVAHLERRLEEAKQQPEEYTQESVIEQAELELVNAKSAYQKSLNRNLVIAKYLKGMRDNYDIDGKMYGVDCAVLTFNRLRNYDATKYAHTALTEPTILNVVATRETTESAILQECEAVKVGRTTGLTTGFLMPTICESLIVGDESEKFTIDRQQQLPFQIHCKSELTPKDASKVLHPTVWFHRQILVRSHYNKRDFLDNGDSGSLVSAKLEDQTVMVIGVAHAKMKTSRGTYGIASPIFAVEHALRVKFYIGGDIP